MRKIKFRGKRLDNGEWAYGDLRQENSGRKVIMTNLSTWGDNADDIEPYGEDVYVYPDTVGQFTGLCDAQGKEIYEGDILRMSYRKDDLGVVKWRNEKSAFTIQEMGKLRWWYLMDRKDEIVGNIHDNKLEDFK